MSEATFKQNQVLRFIRQYNIENGYQPSTRDIMNHFNYKSTNAVSAHLEALERKGYIEKIGKRAIKILRR